MNKKKQIVLKIISGIIVFSFIISFSQFILPSQIEAATTKGLNWDNPNSKGDNPYKINTDAILNSQTMMQVVGCTGLVDKVTTFTTDFLKNQANKLIQKIWKQKAKDKAKTSSCEAVKAALSSALAAAPYNFSNALIDKINCRDIQIVTDTDTTRAIETQTTKEDASKKREECFNGLAYTLAKNQLTSMTRQTVNWVNSGFNGDPMYVQNITSLTNSIEKNILETGIEQLSNGAFPYGRDFSRSVVRSYKNGGIKYGATNFIDSLSSDLAYFVTDKTSYGIGNLDVDPRTALQRAQDANSSFENDFSTGGWDAYLALTQRDQNNPLGFTMITSQYLANRIAQQATETKEEVAQNNGFMSQKTCTLWQLYDKDTGRIKGSFNGFTKKFENETSKNWTNDKDKCLTWDVVTPGSIIKDKLTTYINSPERQLELADTINKSLNSLFTSLIEKFRNEGLFGLSHEGYSYTDLNMGTGYGSNSGSGYDTNPDFATEGYVNDSFDLTRDLGNTFNHEPTVSLGNWNATTNIPELNVGLGPYDEINKGYYGQNKYYTVTYGGSTKLFNNGYSGWAVGDRVFWNGKEWQNWKKGVVNPIEKRGVIQTQKDYVVAAKEILKVLPGIMPKIGELDYCIPGPNPYFDTNSGDAAAAFNEYAGSLQSMYKDGSFFKRDTSTFSIAGPGQTAYIEYKKIFDGTGLWDTIKQTMPWVSLQKLGRMGEIKKDRGEEKIQNEIDQLLNTIQYDIKTFYNNYNNSVFKGIYSTMLSQFKDKEHLATLPENTAFIPMANDGYSITKDILTHASDTTTAVEDYRSAIVQAESNALKLNKIKDAVSIIIKDAQNRRDARLLEQINKLNAFATETCKAEQIECDNNTENVAQCLIEYNICIENAATSGNIISVAEYKSKYADCLDEEDILYYDDTDIMNDTGGDEGIRCFDNLDNDLDGLIDKLDPDCGGAVVGGVIGPVYRCTTGASVSNETENPQNAPCASRDTESECLSDFYYHQSSANVCNWITGADPIKYSLYGCIVDSNVLPKPVPESGNKDCLDRNESECTVNKYINETGMSYSCQFIAL